MSLQLGWRKEVTNSNFVILASHLRCSVGLQFLSQSAMNFMCSYNFETFIQKKKIHKLNPPEGTEEWNRTR